MLSPEVWNFAPPRSSCSYKTCQSDEDGFNEFRKQLFTHHVSITLPDTLQAPPEIINTLIEDNQYYRINEVTAKELFSQNFIDLFVKNGQLTALSINTFSDQDDRLAYIPSGKLILTLTKKTFQEIGIEKKKSSDDSINLVVLDAISISKNNKQFKEIEEKLSKVNLCFDIILVWEPQDEKICPSSIAYYFCQKGYSVKTCDVKVEKKISYNVDVPILDDEVDLESFMEWLGAFNLQCNMSDNSYISTFKYAEKTEMLGQVFHANFTGFITANRVHKFISKINEWMNAKTSSNWIGLVLQGFAGSLIGSKSEQFFQPIGDHHHAIILKRGRPGLVCFFSVKGS